MSTQNDVTSPSVAATEPVRIAGSIVYSVSGITSNTSNGAFAATFSVLKFTTAYSRYGLLAPGTVPEM